jgi:hypothetical protein
VNPVNVSDRTKMLASYNPNQQYDDKAYWNNKQYISFDYNHFARFAAIISQEILAAKIVRRAYGSVTKRVGLLS